MKNEIINKRSYFFFKMAINYLHLVETVSNEVINRENSFVILTDYKITIEEFEERTKWNDYRIAEPFFFNFYHGLELLLKAHLLVKVDDIFKSKHNIEKLFNEFRKLFEDEHTTIKILQNYIGKNLELVEPLSTFFINNKICVKKFYEILKYPESRDSSKIFNYDSLKNNDKKGIKFFEEIKNHISILKTEAIKFHRRYNFIK